MHFAFKRYLVWLMETLWNKIINKNSSVAGRWLCIFAGLVIQRILKNILFGRYLHTYSFLQAGLSLLQLSFFHFFEV